MTDRPNVLLINCDDLGYGDLGCYGSTVHDTPRIDRLAAEGIRLTSFYMASPVCTPSRGAMLTGSYPPRIGFDDFDGMRVLFPGMAQGLAPTEASIGSVLKDAGYATQIVGKWHCGDQPEFLPTEHGFDDWFGLPYSNDMGVQAGGFDEDRIALIEKAGFALPPMPYPPLPLVDGDEVAECQPDQTMLTRRYVDRSLEFLRTNRHRPFFLYFAHMHVHLPLYVEERFHADSRNGPYGAAVHAIDWATGALLDELEELGLADDTIVIFTSDNGALARPGEGSNGPLRGRKTTTHEGRQRVPAIVRWPDRIAAGAVSDGLCTAMDLLPTLSAWCGAALDPSVTIDGRDISGLLLDDGPSPHETFAYYNGPHLEAVRDHRFKLRLVTHRDSRPHPATELYDLVNDLGETTDVSAAHPEIVARLVEAADHYRADLGDRVTESQGSGRREVGRVAEPRPLVGHDEDRPYVIAEYDLEDRG